MSFPRNPKYKDSGVEWLGDVPKVAGIFQMPSANVAPSEPRQSANFIPGLNNV